MSTMKSLMAAAITVTALISGCSNNAPSSNNAPPSPDAQFISTLKSHGLHPPAGMSEDQWEKLQIDNAHSMCDMLGVGPMMRGQALIDESVGDSKIRNEAMVSIYCPDKR
ncbi:DUF732 domain-containing protein [Mycobacterium sp. 852002-40037_SCH5390672]|uniref:DUF732 domain-containing protein n=1 Tax=Mycobacterium sp. 852002-40037_SCH5390672 TaxID=1834089 RepID=UPI000804DB97|nr:DUF732 domain-containing protein [Mycobacterium sp. 852002-40037_SCH5390672]OBC00216.1 hypothetical protein A5782_21660 [Mycobacterium sp. 852002-40037_SCH5390672]